MRLLKLSSFTSACLLIATTPIIVFLLIETIQAWIAYINGGRTGALAYQLSLKGTFFAGSLVFFFTIAVILLPNRNTAGSNFDFRKPKLDPLVHSIAFTIGAWIFFQLIIAIFFKF